MNKLVFALIASTFAVASFAQAPSAAPAVTKEEAKPAMTAPAAEKNMHKKTTKAKKAKKASHAAAAAQ